MLIEGLAADNRHALRSAHIARTNFIPMRSRRIRASLSPEHHNKHTLRLWPPAAPPPPPSAARRAACAASIRSPRRLRRLQPPAAPFAPPASARRAASAAFGRPPRPLCRFHPLAVPPAPPPAARRAACAASSRPPRHLRRLHPLAAPPPPHSAARHATCAASIGSPASPSGHLRRPRPPAAPPAPPPVARRAISAALGRLSRRLHGDTMDLSKDLSTLGSISAHMDSDWACSADRRSITGYVVYYWNSPIMWRSGRQPTSALSSTEAELAAATEGCKELAWLRQIVAATILIPMEQLPAITIYMENRGAENVACDFIRISRRVKHVELKQFYVRHCHDQPMITIIHVPSADNFADGFTKPFCTVQFTE
ncbi:MAG: hypothetical protein BJ554DRAFT_6694 [Olpidium bornovanus]|uniref:Uncharacterized protein n=1 Tax=Olpidium bornovanus TaxID=278681 RepID=A0A8H7ZXJ9_9FUNG|nr:MAG: hypothetical protein BJ554DRAFT_6694 [Olpidium bornovanus]